jgi:hypothetical protein
MGGNSMETCALADSGGTTASMTAVTASENFVPMTQRSFVCTRVKPRASGETKPEAKEP